MNNLEFVAPQPKSSEGSLPAEASRGTIAESPLVSWAAALLYRQPTGAAAMAAVIIGALFNSVFGFIAGGLGILLLRRWLPGEAE